MVDFEVPEKGVVGLPVCVVVVVTTGCGEFKGIRLDVDESNKTVNLTAFASEARFCLVKMCLPVVAPENGSVTFTPQVIGVYSVNAMITTDLGTYLPTPRMLTKFVSIEDASAMGRVPVGCDLH